VNQVVAFFDDSGVFRPEDSGRFACFGMVVIPSAYIRKSGDTWWEMLEGHFRLPSSLQTIGIEAKSSELCDMLHKLKQKSKLQNTQQKMFNYGLNTPQKVSDLIETIFAFLSEAPVITKYLAVAVNKVEVWQSYNQFNRWRYLAQQHDKGSNKEIKNLSKGLSAFLVKYAYEFLLQRLDYLSRDGEKGFDFSDAFVIGDETADSSVMLKAQAEIQAGLGKHFSPLQVIVNRPWFGSSLHDPCLQMADWIAFTVRTWAEENIAYSHRIEQLLPTFRGYPEILGSGIVLCPNKECFPALPL
jgi:hypothetical protein